jgi:hypothetical protein
MKVEHKVFSEISERSTVTEEMPADINDENESKKGNTP